MALGRVAEAGPFAALQMCANPVCQLRGYTLTDSRSDQVKWGLVGGYSILHDSWMELSARDYSVVQFVGRFYQAASVHVAAVCLPEVSTTPLDRTLTRLVNNKFLVRVGRRPSGIKGGAGAYVYQLGPRGWHLLNMEGRYRPYRSINHHALKVVDVYADLVAAERSGAIRVLHAELETPLGDIRPDLRVELGLVQQGKKVSYCIEVDLGSERPRIIQGKCDSYIRAYQRSTAAVFPYVVFLVPDEWRKSEVSRVLCRLGNERELFQCHLLTDGVSKLIAQ